MPALGQWRARIRKEIRRAMIVEASINREGRGIKRRVRQDYRIYTMNKI